jgi:hypothetical protein
MSLNPGIPLRCDISLNLASFLGLWAAISETFNIEFLLMISHVNTTQLIWGNDSEPSSVFSL